jgi:hypothetical protein
MTMSNDTSTTTESDPSTDHQVIRPGDICLDLAQGRPVHVLEDTGLTAAEWSEQNDYDLLENYANERFDATEHDRVYDVVYCSSAKSEPSKSYAFPESRLLRSETEAADGGAPVAVRERRRTLTALLSLAPSDTLMNEIEELAQHAFGKDLAERARYEALSEDQLDAFDPRMSTAEGEGGERLDPTEKPDLEQFNAHIMMPEDDR